MQAVATLGHEVRTLSAGSFGVIESSYRAGEVLPRHFHEGAFLTFASRGSFAEILRTHALDCGPFDVIARPAGEMHANRYGAAGTTCVLVHLTEDRVARLFEEPATLPRAIAAPFAMRIAGELAGRDELSPLIIEGLLLELIGTVLRPALPRQAPPWVERVREAIHDAPLQTTRELAELAGVHPTTLVRAFRSAFRCSPGEYVRRVRIERAMAALASTGQPIADIAVANGFYDQSHFTNVFRRHTRMTPAEYRRARVSRP